MSIDLFDYHPIHSWNGNVANVGMPTPDGNAKVTEIIIYANDAVDATMKCLELSTTSDYYVAAATSPVLDIVRSFFGGDGTAEIIEIILAQAFIVSPSRIQIWANEPVLPAEFIDELRANPNALFHAGTNISFSEYLLLERTPPPLLAMTVPISRPVIKGTSLHTDNLPPAYNRTEQMLERFGVLCELAEIQLPAAILNSHLLILNIPIPAPTSFDASDANTSAPGVVGLAWAYVNDAVSYNIYRSTDKDAFDTLEFDWTNLKPNQTLVANVVGTQYNDTTIDNIGTYYYWIGPVFLNTSGQNSIGLLFPGNQCSAEYDCDIEGITTESASDAANEAACLVGLTGCYNDLSNTEELTRRLDAPTNWIPAFNSPSNCNLTSNRCYYSSNSGVSWNWYGSAESTCDFNKGNWPTLYWVWKEPSSWLSVSGNWEWNYSPELCIASGNTWDMSLLGEEGSVAGDPYVEKVDNLVATEALTDTINVTWQSNPTVDPLQGECAICEDDSNNPLPSVLSQTACEDTGLCCDDNTFDNNEVSCELAGYCSQNAFEVKRYSNYTSAAFDDNVDWFDTASQIDVYLAQSIQHTENTSWVALHIQGYFVPTQSASYKFKLESDDASRMWIGTSGEFLPQLKARRIVGNEFLDNGGDHGMITVSDTINLIAGERYPIIIHYGNSYLTGGLSFSYQIGNSSTDIFNGASSYRTSKNDQNLNEVNCPVNSTCSNSTWTTQSSCEDAGSCNQNATYNNDSSGCVNLGDCEVDYIYNWDTSYNFTVDQITSSQCNAYQDWNVSVTWTQNTFTSQGNAWTVYYGTWTMNTFVNDGNEWKQKPQWSDPPSCVQNSANWVPDDTIQNTPESYNIYRATQNQHSSYPIETTFIANKTHIGGSISTQSFLDASPKTRFELYYYKVTQIAGGVEGDFSIVDSGWQQEDSFDETDLSEDS